MNLTKYYSDMIYRMQNEEGKFSEAIMQIMDAEIAALDLIAGEETKTELERMKVFVIETGKEFLGGKKGVL